MKQDQGKESIAIDEDLVLCAAKGSRRLLRPPRGKCRMDYG